MAVKAAVAALLLHFGCQLLTDDCIASDMLSDLVQPLQESGLIGSSEEKDGRVGQEQPEDESLLRVVRGAANLASLHRDGA